MSRPHRSSKLMVGVAALAVAVVVVGISPVGAAFKPTRPAIKKVARHAAKKVAKKVARKQVVRMAPGLSVAHAETTEGFERFHMKLSFGQSKVIARNGMVSIVAECRADIGAQGQDELRLLARSTGDAFMQGDTPHSGPGVGSNYLTPETPADNRTLGGIVSTAAGEGMPAAEDDIDTGFVMGTDGKAIHIDETTAYALHVAGADCLTSGYVALTG